MVPRALGPQAWPRVSCLTEEMPQFSCHSHHMPVRPTCGAQLLPVGVGLPGACSQQLVLSWCSWPEERTQGLMPTSRKQAWDDLLWVGRLPIHSPSSLWRTAHGASVPRVLARVGDPCHLQI